MTNTLSASEKIQSDAAREGFAWPDIVAALDKVQEELDELRECADNCDSNAFFEEFGDLLFACVGLAIPSGRSAVSALQHANHKFSERYSRMKRGMTEAGQDLCSSSLKEKLEHWNVCK
ncbi:uncharacterized protein YabN with tetrapyrrole methylase and pyrophosphatase domain [Sinorhizobium terangae]|uniref:NTP pyrophosphohydrolase MazG putative catalytic core domain-containing protein n=1 Tax=Sinorhizobium terangae TaxID=110322 RepID=A0A6N7LJG5_SINTE|nr:hypothetical protein [Sinorhizobium terangae]MBB4189259.1 uncharacterized protein YabN with tetrapyrrole methylase and pyrophosphatase domain [Sinorhizobium terangae]MQX17450.1 hypothetical protein [Sinorhizobium terangae]